MFILSDMPTSDDVMGDRIYEKLGLRKIALAYEEAKRQESILRAFRFPIPFELSMRIQESEKILECAIMRSMHEDA